MVADKEWDAIKAAQQLKVEWSDVKPPFPDQAALYEHIRKAPVRKREVDGKQTGNVDEAFKTAARVIEAEYEWPFQSHACMGPACALVEIKDGNVTCWTGSQKPHFVQNGIARSLGIPVEKVRSIWVVGPGSYGRSDADDAAMDAAILAKAVGKPVRVQYTRDQATGWDPKGPASIHRARAAIDAAGNVIAYEFNSKGFSRVDVNTNGGNPLDTLAGHFRGVELKSGDNFGVPAESYEFANKRMGWETIPPLLDRASPLRGAHLRDPVGPQIHFASESFMDEVAAALGHRSDRVPPAPRQGPARHRRDQGRGREGATGSRGRRRGRTRPAARSAGAASPTRSATARAAPSSPKSMSIARPAGSGRASSRSPTTAARSSIPIGLTQTIEGNIVQGVSRTLWEEVKFDAKNVTSIDWMTYPILDITETPETIDVALIDRPEIAPTGGGEPSIRPVAAAIANAIFDATGVRIRRVPFSPDRVKQALS